jgi:hypothetical protein
MNSLHRYLLIAGLFMLGLNGCKKWDDHTAISNPDLETNLVQAIAANPSLSKFSEYVTKTGMDSVLRSSKTYTVWAPSNDALQSLDPAIVNDVAKLRLFVQNHIANQTYYIRNAPSATRVPMLNGKYNTFNGNQFAEAAITTADKLAKNGVLHVINKRVEVLPSVWEFITATKAQYKQNELISALDYEYLDSSRAIVDSISSTTGNPIFRPGTGIVIRNRFDQEVYDTKNEQKQYTYFVIQDAEFIKESDSLKVYFATASPSVTDTLAKWSTVKDLMVEGAYPASALTNLVSRFGTPIPLNGTELVETRKLSNGIVHIFSKIDVLNKDKFKEIVVQGEAPSGFLVNRTGNTNYRVRLNPITNKDFMDIMITGHGVTTYYAYYRLNNVPSIKYKVYALGVNDFQGGTFAQTIVPKYYVAPSTYFTLASLTHNVPLFSAVGAYNEVLLGEFTMTNVGVLEIQLVSTAMNPLVLDYLRLVPVP